MKEQFTPVYLSKKGMKDLKKSISKLERSITAAQAELRELEYGLLFYQKGRKEYDSCYDEKRHNAPPRCRRKSRARRKRAHDGGQSGNDACDKGCS